MIKHAIHEIMKEVITKDNYLAPVSLNLYHKIEASEVKNFLCIQKG